MDTLSMTELTCNRTNCATQFYFYTRHQFLTIGKGMEVESTEMTTPESQARTTAAPHSTEKPMPVATSATIAEIRNKVQFRIPEPKSKTQSFILHKAPVSNHST
jgi:hypothetical protein